MGVDLSIDMNPLTIKGSTNLEALIRNISLFEEQFKCTAGVGKLQNLSFGSCYLITSEREAKRDIKKPGRKNEFFIKFYPKSYFEEKLKEYSV